VQSSLQADKTHSVFSPKSLGGREHHHLLETVVAFLQTGSAPGMEPRETAFPLGLSPGRPLGQTATVATSRVFLLEVLTACFHQL